MMRQNITAETLFVTPTLSAELLRLNTKNRPLSESTVRKYSSAMSRGEWRANGESIVIDESGRLVNGQHRLHACIKSGVKFWCVVVRGVASDAFSTMDNGKSRSASDVLAINGEHNYIRLASGARSLVFMKSQGRAQGEITNTQVAECLELHPKLRKWAGLVVGAKSNPLPSAIVGVLTLMDELHGSATAMVFFEKAVQGLDLRDGDPELILRDRYLSRGKGISITAAQSLAFLVKAANARISGKRLHLLRWARDEAFPRLIGFQLPHD